MMAAGQRILSVKDALAEARAAFRVVEPSRVVEAPRRDGARRDEPSGADDTPSPMQAIRPRGEAARGRAAAIDADLAALAAEIGTGRDQALLRALGFYRRFVARARRAGRAPEAFLSELAEAHDRRDVGREIADLRARVEALASSAHSIAVTTAAPAPEPVSSITFTAVTESASARRPSRPTPVRRATEPRPPTRRKTKPTPKEPSKMRPSPACAPVAAPASAPVHAPVAAPAPAPAPVPAAPAPTLGFTPSVDAPSTAASYADRRARLPKMTF